MTSAPLNVFQRLTRQWDALHPYNAGQVLHLRGRADPERLSACWNQTLRDLGLGRVRVNGRRYSVVELNGDATPDSVRVVDSNLTIDELISRELNHAFPPHDEFPFRPFVLQHEAGSYYIGVIYHHWVADSTSIRAIVREWFARTFELPELRRDPLPLPRGGYWSFFGPHRARWSLAGGLFTSANWSSRFKRVRRIETPQFQDFTTSFSSHAAPDGLIDALRCSAKSRGVTVNDLFLAGIAEACDRYVPAMFTKKRQDLALGSIVDLRTRCHGVTGEPDALSEAFGLFLGFTSVILRPNDLADFDRTLHRVSTQSRIHKLDGTPEASMIRILAGLVAGRLLHGDRTEIVNFYRKRVPLAGGISNVNLNDTWAAAFHPDPLLRYIRVSPTGPMMPLVFTTTTLGNRLNFGLTARASVIDAERASSIAKLFIERLTSLA